METKGRTSKEEKQVKAYRFKFLQLVRKAGWEIKRQEGDHYIVVHPIYGQSRFSIPSIADQGAISEIRKRLHLDEMEKRKVEMSQFRTKQHGKMPKEGTYGYELYAARAGRRLPIVDLAKLVGVHATTVVGWENNDSFPQPKAQERLAQIFDNPRLVVIKSATQQITDASPSERLGETVPIVETVEKVHEPEKVEKFARRPVIKRTYKPRGKQVVKKSTIETVESESISHEQFNEAMLTIRTYITQLEKSVKTWETVKELLKDEA